METKLYIAKLKSISPLGQSAPIRTPRGSQEGYDEYENRVWKERLHVDKNGMVFIPPMAFFYSICEAAAREGMKVPGRRGATYKKLFESGILIHEPIVTNVKADDVALERLFVPSDGKRGGGTRVWKNFPRIDEWKAEAKIYVINQLISAEVLAKHIETSGMLVGLGFFRPQTLGFWGRFQCEELKLV